MYNSLEEIKTIKLQLSFAQEDTILVKLNIHLFHTVTTYSNKVVSQFDIKYRINSGKK